VLNTRGVEQLYTHQTTSIEHALARRNVVVTTPTASGKTLCYNAPVLSTILRAPSARALSGDESPIGVFTYDGDTPQDARREIRGRAHIVLSNPDMIHSGILPHHPGGRSSLRICGTSSSTNCMPIAGSSVAI
jgi:DEAD/DEAH box helicase domain-containing protein